MPGQNAQQDDSAIHAATSRRWRRYTGRAVLIMAVGVGLLVVLAPAIVAHTPLRDVALGIVFPRLAGKIHADRASLGWWSPVEFHDVRILPPSAPAGVTIDTVRGDTPLWRLLWDRKELGQFDVLSPRIEATRRSPVSASARPATPVEKKPPASSAVIRPPDLDVLFAVRDARVTFLDAEGARRWSLGPLKVSAGLRRAAAAEGTPPEVFVQAAKLVDRLDLSPEICDDLLAFVTPMMSGAVRAEGSFSLSIDDGFVALSQPRQGRLGGKLVVHHAAVRGGAMVDRLARLFGLQSAVRLADESHIRFFWDGQRFYHDSAEFSLGKLAIRTSGSVGMDRTLDLVANVVLPKFESEDTPLREALSGRTISIPIGGTVDDPLIDAKFLANNGFDILAAALEPLLEGRPVVAEILSAIEKGKLLDRWRNLRAARPSPSSGEASRPPLFDWRQRMRRLFPGNRRRGKLLLPNRDETDNTTPSPRQRPRFGRPRPE